METIPRVVFVRILMFATENGKRLKSTVKWERVSKRFAERLAINFWPDIQDIIVRFFPYFFTPFPMRIGSENYESIDMRVLMALKRKGVQRLFIIFAPNTDKNYFLPVDFATSVPFPVSIQLGNHQNLNDPELLRVLRCYRDSIEGLHFFITNPTINETFMDALLNMRSLKCITLFSHARRDTPSIFFRKALFSKLSQLSLQCLILFSSGTHGHKSTFDLELFKMLECQRVNCLHLNSFSHYIERWIATDVLHNRAQITNLCISNDQFGYNAAEEENKTVPLFHTLANYKLLFPKLQFLCIGIPCIPIDDSSLESMLLCYLDNPLHIKVRLTVRVLHNLLEIPFKKFDWLLSKMRTLNADIDIFLESKTDGRIRISSQMCNIFYELSIRCGTLPPEKKDYVFTHKLLSCADTIHHHRGAPIACLCASNND